MFSNLLKKAFSEAYSIKYRAGIVSSPEWYCEILIKKNFNQTV